MAEEFCPECGARITGSTGFCPECGAVTTSLENQIKETKRIKREEEEKRAEQSRIAREKRINFIKKNKYYLIGLLILIIAVVATVIIMDSLDTSNRTYECEEYTLEYPHNYMIVADYKEGYNNYDLSSYMVSSFQPKDDKIVGSVKIQIADHDGSLKDVADDLIHREDYGIKNKNGGSTKVDGHKARIVEGQDGDWTNVMFMNNNRVYQIVFEGECQKDMDTFLNSFKLK